MSLEPCEPDVLFELRVLSGLHQGAALPLFGEQWCIGAHQEADLELYDPGIADRHARLTRVDGRWIVQAQEGLLQDETGATLAHIANLIPGAEFSIGGIRLCVLPMHTVSGGRRLQPCLVCRARPCPNTGEHRPKGAWGNGCWSP